MTREQIKVLIPAFAGFHQDFDLDEELTERDVLSMHARGVTPHRREALYSALDALLGETSSEDQFRAACRAAGAHFTPRRQGLEEFVAWARTPEGAAEIAGPGPISMYKVTQLKVPL